jgi:hypothetical protein
MKTILKKFKNGDCIEVKLYRKKSEAIKAGEAFKKSVKISDRVKNKMYYHTVKA